MKKRFAVVGNSLAVVIDKPIRNILGIGRKTMLDVSTDGRRIIIEPLDGPRRLSPPVLDTSSELSAAEHIDAPIVFSLLANRFVLEGPRWCRSDRAGSAAAAGPSSDRTPRCRRDRREPR